MIKYLIDKLSTLFNKQEPFSNDVYLNELPSIITLQKVFDTSENAFESASYISRFIADVDLITGNNIKVSLEDKISKLIKRNKLIILHAYTKQGKTVLIKKIFSNQPHIFLSGGTIRSADSIWSEINLQSNIPHSVVLQKSEQQSVTQEVNATTNIGPSYLAYKQHDKMVGVGTNIESNGETYHLDAKASAAKILKNSGKTLIIDDFHFLPNEVQRELIQFSRAVIGYSPVIFITTSSHVFDSVNAHDELKGRAEYIALPKWEIPDLEKIAQNGFEKLNCIVDQSLIDFIVKNSFHSPFLAQDICYELCSANSVVDNSQQIVLQMPTNKLAFLTAIANKNYSEPYSTILKIKNHSTNQYRLKNSEEVDIYGLIREGIVSNDNFFPSINVNDISQKMTQLLDDPASCNNILGQTKQNLKIMYGESKKANQIIEETQQKKSDPPLEYIENITGDFIVFHDPMLALYLITQTKSHNL